MPFAAFYTLVFVSDRFSKYLQWVKPIGELSLFIYLIHPLVFHTLKMVIGENFSNSIATGMLFYILTLGITFTVSYILQKIINKSSFLKSIF